MMQDAWPGQLVSGAPAAAPVRQPAPARPAPRPAAPRPAMPQIRFADDRDAMIRTVLMEAGAEPPEGQQAVAAVIRNRSRQRGLSPQQVVLEPNQFEPWGNPETASRGMSIRPDSPEYQRAAALVDQVLGGVDPTNGADHFFAPAAQAALGRPVPEWARGQPTVIGGHNFYNLGGSDEAARTQAAQGAWPGQPAPVSTPEAEPETPAGPGNDLLGSAKRLIEEPWLLNTPRPVAGEAGGFNEDGSFDVNRPGSLRLPDGSYEIYDEGTDAYYPATAEQFAQWQARQAEERRVRIERIAMEATPEYQAEYAAAREATENVPAWLANLSQGNSLGLVGEAVAATNFLAPMTEGVDRGTAYEAGRAAWRGRQSQLVQDDPMGSIGMQLVGGLLTPGLKGSGEWINGATGAQKLGRAGVVGGGYGVVQGAINSEETGLASRGGEGARGGLLGAGVGAVGQRAVDRLGAAAAARRANPSQARLLSNQGVDLTPGQMMGGAAQRVEDGLQSLPVLGDSIKSARNRNMGTFDRAAINEALAPIGQTVRGSGRDAIRQADDALSAEYGRILDPLTITPDAQFATDVQAALNPLNLSQRARDRLSDTVADIEARLQGPISGRDFKQIESELTALIRSAEIGGPDGRPLVQPLRAVREALRDNLRRQDPIAADDLAATNAAYANFDHIRRAASNPATARNDGLFSPGNLNSVLARTEGRNYGRGEGRLQGLSDAGVAVLGDKVPDSGTPLRSLLMIGAPGAGGLTMAGQGEAVAVTAAVAGLGSLGYGKLAQRALNALYRRSDPGATRDVLAELSRVASRDPAALPFYEQILSALTPDQRPEPQPARAGLLNPTQNTRQGLLAQP